MINLYVIWQDKFLNFCEEDQYSHFNVIDRIQIFPKRILAFLSMYYGIVWNWVSIGIIPFFLENTIEI